MIILKFQLDVFQIVLSEFIDKNFIYPFGKNFAFWYQESYLLKS